MEPVDTLSFSPGSWSIERRIDDRRSGCMGPSWGPPPSYDTSSERDAGAPVLGQLAKGRRVVLGSYKGLGPSDVDYVVTTAVSSLHFSDGGPTFVDVDLPDGCLAADHHVERTDTR